jgi:hypothetical protein
MLFRLFKITVDFNVPADDLIIDTIVKNKKDGPMEIGP